MEKRNTNKLKITQFISQNPGKSGVTKIISDIAKNTKIAAICLKKTVRSKRYKDLEAIGNQGDFLLMAWQKD